MATIFRNLQPFLSQARRRALALVLPLGVALALAGLPRAQAQAIERVKAPELDGAVGSLGSDRPILLKDLRGKVVVLDFWTLC